MGQGVISQKEGKAQPPPLVTSLWHAAFYRTYIYKAASRPTEGVLLSVMSVHPVLGP